jgi:mannose-6-phosphate isomerase-like protein (cupin superfamily)
LRRTLVRQGFVRQKDQKRLKKHLFQIMASVPAPLVVSKAHPINKYEWGKKCAAWSLVENDGLSVKLESMPPGTEEALHFHETAQQFFFILKGTAVFEIDEVILMMHEGEGINIAARQKHRIMNKEEQTILEFLIVSQPSAKNDRQNIG